MFRVLNVLFDDKFGGPHKRVMNVGLGLQKYGIDTLVVLPDMHGNAKSILLENRSSVVVLSLMKVPNPRNFMMIFFHLVFLIKDIILVSKVIVKEDIDVVHVNGAFFLAPSFAAKCTRRPLVWHLNDTVVSPFLAKLFGLMVKVLADEVVVAADAVAVHYGVRNCSHSVIYAPVDVNAIKPKPHPYKSLVQSSFKIGMIANWNPLKGLEVFVNTAVKIKSKLGNCSEFIIAGAKLDSHSKYAAYVNDLVCQYGMQEYFRFLGFVDDMPKLLHGLDVLVLSSWSEACPMAVLEAMAAALPVVSTDVGGVRELLRPDSNDCAGYVVPTGDSSQLAKCVIALCLDQDLRRRMGSSGRKMAEERFSLDGCIEAHSSIYKKVLRRSKS